MSRAKSKDRKYTSARERADKQSTGFTSPYLTGVDGITFFKPKAGTALLDILPYEVGKGNPWAEPGSLHWERTFWVHRGIGANSDSYLCPRMSSKKRCPICEARLKLMKDSEGDEDKEALVKDLAPKQRQLFNVIDRKDPEQKIQLWDFSYHLFGKALDARLRNSDDDDDYARFFFLEDGLTLRVGFAEQTFAGHAYFEAEAIDFKARKTPYDDDILEKVHNLDELLVETPYDELKDIFLQLDAEDDDTSSKKSKKKPVVDDEDDEDEDEEDDTDDEEDEDEEEETPKKKSAPAAKKKVVEDDEEEDDDDDEDEEDEPAPKKSKKVVEDDDEDDWDDDDDEEDEKPALKKSKKKVVEDEEEDEEEEEEEKPRVKAYKPPVEDDEDEEDEDEEPAPKKKSAPAPAAKKKVVEEDEEDDWEDFEDDEEPAPKKKKK